MGGRRAMGHCFTHRASGATHAVVGFGVACRVSRLAGVSVTVSVTCGRSDSAGVLERPCAGPCGVWACLRCEASAVASGSARLAARLPSCTVVLVLRGLMQGFVRMLLRC
eukprot:3806855-Alexandrium_andersonii.AAC.1